VALTLYQQLTQQLLHDTSATIFPVANLTNYINIARQQIALEGEVLRALGTVAVSSFTYAYPFANVVPSVSNAGLASVGVVRQVWWVNSAGTTTILLQPRPWEWYSAFCFPSLETNYSQPQLWAQLGSGLAGQIFLYPDPSANASLTVDANWVPVALTSDSTPEALPLPWTQAVPYYAAYLAYLYAQRSEDANEMWQLYELFMKRARQTTTSSLLAQYYPGANNGTALAGMSSTLTMGRGAQAPGG
jgi:hypothetical protein